MKSYLACLGLVPHGPYTSHVAQNCDLSLMFWSDSIMLYDLAISFPDTMNLWHLRKLREVRIPMKEGPTPMTQLIWQFKERFGWDWRQRGFFSRGWKQNEGEYGCHRNPEKVPGLWLRCRWDWPAAPKSEEGCQGCNSLCSPLHFWLIWTLITFQCPFHDLSSFSRSFTFVSWNVNLIPMHDREIYPQANQRWILLAFCHCKPPFMWINVKTLLSIKWYGFS